MKNLKDWGNRNQPQGEITHDEDHHTDSTRLMFNTFTIK